MVDFDAKGESGEDRGCVLGTHTTFGKAEAAAPSFVRVMENRQPGRAKRGWVILAKTRRERPNTRLPVYTLASTPNAMESSMGARVGFGLVMTVSRKCQLAGPSRMDLLIE